MQSKGSLQHKFNSFGAQPSQQVWQSIASNLDNKRRKKALIIWWTTGVAASLLIVFGFQFLSSQPNLIANKNEINNKQNQVKNTPIIPTKKSNYSTTDLSSNEHKTNTKNTPLPNNLKVTNQKKTLVSNDKKNTYQKPEIKNTQRNITVKNENYKATDVIKLNRDLTVNLKNEVVLAELASQNIDYTPKQVSKWEFGAKIQSHIGFNSPSSYDNISFTSGDFTSSLITPNGNLKTTRPLTFRFEFKRKAKKRIGFKTGIDVGWIFTKYSQSIYSYNKSIITVGIPLKLDLKLFSKKRFALHTDFGLVNDIPVVEFGKNELLNESLSQSTTIIYGFLGGLEVGINANYNLNENLKINAGTGLKWYYLQRISGANPFIQQSVFGSFNLGLIWQY